MFGKECFSVLQIKGNVGLKEEDWCMVMRKQVKGNQKKL